MDRRAFLRNTFAGAAAAAAAPLAAMLPAVTAPSLFLGEVGFIEGVRIIQRTPTSFGALSAAQKQLWSRDIWQAARERYYPGFSPEFRQATADRLAEEQRAAAVRRARKLAIQELHPKVRRAEFAQRTTALRLMPQC